ncbi:hypothetical protein SAMN05421752_11520 [Natronorubrum thiooxidans]|uniref:Uncharacterized protein n=1 Tax=Natronorubrum thiooxidans TaxID=308853 RepID=A0A1N7GSV3_9EURY|nr:hypothetical protein SAMN05421752_11520 [Natronorubrum thiooxidans]
MSLREVLGPDSLDQIVYVTLVWAIIVLASAYVLDDQIVRLETVIGTGILFVWIVWGVNYRLQQVQQERYKQKR